MPIYLSFKENFKFGGIESAEEGSKKNSVLFSILFNFSSISSEYIVRYLGSFYSVDEAII